MSSPSKVLQGRGTPRPLVWLRWGQRHERSLGLHQASIQELPLAPPLTHTLSAPGSSRRSSLSSGVEMGAVCTAHAASLYCQWSNFLHL
jgi:hypothetical protein